MRYFVHPGRTAGKTVAIYQLSHTGLVFVSLPHSESSLAREWNRSMSYSNEGKFFQAVLDNELVEIFPEEHALDFSYRYFVARVQDGQPITMVWRYADIPGMEEIVQVKIGKMGPWSLSTTSRTVADMMDRVRLGNIRAVALEEIFGAHPIELRDLN